MNVPTTSILFFYIMVLLTLSHIDVQERFASLTTLHGETLEQGQRGGYPVRVQHFYLVFLLNHSHIYVQRRVPPLTKFHGETLAFGFVEATLKIYLLQVEAKDGLQGPKVLLINLHAQIAIRGTWVKPVKISGCVSTNTYWDFNIVTINKMSPCICYRTNNLSAAQDSS